MTLATNQPEPLGLVEAIFQKLGGFSYFQLWASFVLLAPEVPAAMIAMLPVFIAGTDKVDGDVGILDIHGDMKFERNLGTFKYNEAGNLTLIEVTTLVEEWGLRGPYAWVTEMFTSVFMAGMMTGAFLASQMADRFGRKKVQYTLILLMAVCGTASAWANHPIVYAVTRYFAGIGVGGYYCIYSIYLMEFLIPSWRVICGSVSLWFLGEMSLALGLYFTSSWRKLSIISALPAALLLLTYPYIPETPRWLLCQGRTSEAEVVFNTIAKWNGKPEVQRSEVEDVQKRTQSSETGEEGSLCKLWTNRKLRLQLVIFSVSCFSVAFTYYGISFNTKNLSGDPVLNMIYLAVVDMFGFPLGAVFSQWQGRRRTVTIFLMMGSGFLFCLVVGNLTNVLEGSEWLVRLLCLLGRFGIAAAWGVIVCFAAESFPTVVRSTAMGICCLMANTGGVLAPQIAFVGTKWPIVPHIVFCALVTLSVGLSWLLKEMTGEPLQDFA